jgi:hypothetical protein
LSNSPSALNEITAYIYGTNRLGDERIPLQERIKVAHAAMDAGVWFHTSRMYRDALEVLGEAFAQEPAKIPKLIIKIGWNNINQLRGIIEENLKPLGLVARTFYSKYLGFIMAPSTNWLAAINFITHYFTLKPEQKCAKLTS